MVNFKLKVKPKISETSTGTSVTFRIVNSLELI